MTRQELIEFAMWLDEATEYFGKSYIERKTDLYLKGIGYEKYIKGLQHHKDTTVGLYAFDKELDDIFKNIPNEKSCKTAAEAYLVQQIEYLKSIVFRIS
jgi:hypothetical protein